MTTEKSKPTPDQGTKGQPGDQQVTPSTPQQAAIDEIKNLFQEATRQIQQVPPRPPLEKEALKVVETYEGIKRALRPPTKDSPYLFSLEPDFVSDLDIHPVSKKLREQFDLQNKSLTPQAQVEVNQAQSAWTIVDGDTRYSIRSENRKLKVYGST